MVPARSTNNILLKNIWDKIDDSVRKDICLTIAYVLFCFVVNGFRRKYCNELKQEKKKKI